MKKSKKSKKVLPPEPEAMEEEPMPVPEPEAATPELPGIEYRIEYNQPKASPYEHPIATVLIGTKSYGIPVYYLQGLPHIKRQLEWNTAGDILLGDVDEDIGHTLVHFLYTGQYETLDSMCDRVKEYRRSVLAYQAARTYRLLDLEAVARKYIEHFGAMMQLGDILDTARKVFTKLPIDEVWFTGYLREYFVQSFREDNRFFHREELTESMGESPRFDRAIMRLTVEILSARISELKDTVERVVELEPASEPESLPEPVPEPETDIAPEPAPEYDWSRPMWASNFAAKLPTDHREPGDVGFSEEEAQIPEPEVCCSAEEPAEEPSTENYEPTPGPPSAEYPPEIYDNSVVSPRPLSPVEVGPVAEGPQDEYPAQEQPVPEPAPSDFNYSWHSLSSRKQKKKKKNSSIAAQPLPVPVDWR